jgi:MarR family transcriptional regulator, 2-MHQ and catechol-resistance regulon repressor
VGLHRTESFLDIKHLNVEVTGMRAASTSGVQQTEGVHLWLLLWKATRAIEQNAHASVRKMGLGLTDFAILEALLHKGPLPVNAFRDKVLLTSGSLTAAVDRLERDGWVKRASTPKDRRTRIVHLTEKGRRLIEQSFREHSRDMEQAFVFFSPAERARLTNLLRKLGHSMDNFGQKASFKKKGNKLCQNKRKSLEFMRRQAPIGWETDFLYGLYFHRTGSRT